VPEPFTPLPFSVPEPLAPLPFNVPLPLLPLWSVLPDCAAAMFIKNAQTIDAVKNAILFIKTLVFI
jgi:hypothetical protein